MATEDTWRPPNAWCPETRYWHAADDQATEDEVTELAAAFIRALQPETAVETGTWTGRTTRAIGAALARNGHGNLHAVESNPSLAEQARQACAGLPVTVITGDSLSWEPPDGIGSASTLPFRRGTGTTGALSFNDPKGEIGKSAEVSGGPPMGCSPPAPAYGMYRWPRV